MHFGRRKIQYFLFSISLLLFACLWFFWPRGIHFSVQSGFYDDPFILKLTTTPGAKIYYTLDGSEPTTNSTLYTSDGILIQDRSTQENKYANIGDISVYGDFFPDFPVDKGTCIKAMAVYGGLEKSKTYTETYFVGFQNKEGYDDVMVMAMTINDEDFFSYENGIYVLGKTYDDWLNTTDDPDTVEMALRSANYTMDSRDWEREVNIKLWNDTSSLLTNENIGIRIRGGFSRAATQKSFNFYARDFYGEDSYFLNSYMLRTSGVYDTYKTMLRDVFAQKLVSDRDIAIQSALPCILFLNGEFWGLYNLQDRFTAPYFNQKYSIKQDNLIVIKRGAYVSEGTNEDFKLYEQLISYAAQNNLSNPDFYHKISQMMDIQSFIDYLCFECYIANWDWPQNNVCCFRSREITDNLYNDGKWRWAAYDTDSSTGNDHDSTADSKRFIELSLPSFPLAISLLENDSFKQQFVTTFCDMANVNFDYENVHSQLYQLADVYAIPVVKTQNRFKYSKEEYNEGTFWEHIARVDTFFKERKDYALPYLYDAMELSGNECDIRLEINEASAGTIQLNTVTPDLSNGYWEGTYFTDYPVTVTAIPNEGYRFLGWEEAVSSGKTTETVNLTGEKVTIRAIFEPIN